MNHRTKVLKAVFPVFLFAVAFIPRTLQQVEIYAIWHARGKLFIEAVLSQQWADTLLGPHPGVVTMWLSGLAQKIGSLVDPGFADKSLVQKMDVELIPFALVISLGIVLIYFLLATIFDHQVAAVACLLLSLDPYHISISKGIHVDALIAVFAMISALFLWAYIQNQRRLYLLLSGIFAGAALLSKAPALFLIPYFLLVIGGWLASKLFLRNEATIQLNKRHIAGLVKEFILALLIWIVGLATIYFLLWPSMWVQPLKSLTTTYGLAGFYLKTPHPNPEYFLGQITTGDPGPLFYPISILIKTTSVTLVGFLMAVVIVFNPKLEQRKRMIILLGLAFVFFFVLMMSLGAKKKAPYAFPALQFFPLLAGIGIVYFFRWLTKGRAVLLNLLLVFVVIIQAVISLGRHPYYGTHYNYLLGGPKTILTNNIVAGQEKGEGLEIAADYLNNLPASQLLVVGTHSPISFNQYFWGKTVPLTDDKVDYMVFTRNWMLRGLDEDQWGDLWEIYRSRDPKLVIDFDGVPYAWIYKVGPLISDELITHEVNAEFGQEIRLLGYDFTPSEIQAGDSVTVTLYWESLVQPTDDYTVFNHLLDPSGQMQAQKDNQPQGGMYPTSFWNQGERIQDVFELNIDPQAPTGVYDFAIGMYTLETLERIPIMMPDGSLAEDARLILPGPSIFASDD